MGMRKYPIELRERATRMTLEALADHERAPGDAIRRIADELGVHPEALRTWVRQAEVGRSSRPGTTTADAERIRLLEKEVRELRRGARFCARRARTSPRRGPGTPVGVIDSFIDDNKGLGACADMPGPAPVRSQGRPVRLLRPPDSSPVSKEQAQRGLQGRDQTGPNGQVLTLLGRAQYTRCSAIPRRGLTMG